MRACSECLGMSWIGIGESATPRPTCNPDGAGKPPAPAKPEVKETLQWADAPGKSGLNDPGEPASAYFSPAEVERARQKEPNG